MLMKRKVLNFIVDSRKYDSIIHITHTTPRKGRGTTIDASGQSEIGPLTHLSRRRVGETTRANDRKSSHVLGHLPFLVNVVN